VRRDFAAVSAAFQFPYSNGPTEGFVNRLKLLKRSTYGRAGFELFTSMGALQRRLIWLGTISAGEPLIIDRTY